MPSTFDYVIAVLAKLCGVAKSAIAIKMGTSGHIKRVTAVEGMSDDALRSVLNEPSTV